jgi:alpha-tubulin suppressor-like RCC1 family protein
MIHKEKCQIISCGFEHCIALMDHGRVYTWGYGGSGVLGHSSYQTEESPKMVNGLQQVKYVEAGGYHSAIID